MVRLEMSIVLIQPASPFLPCLRRTGAGVGKRSGINFVPHAFQGRPGMGIQNQLGRLHPSVHASACASCAVSILLLRAFNGTFRGPCASDGWPLSLTAEWNAIQGAAGYGRGFVPWVLQYPCFAQFPCTRPNLDFVRDLQDFVRYDLEALSHQVSVVRAKSFRYQLQVDAKDFSGSQCFVRVRPPQKPPFTCLHVRSTQRVQVQLRHSHQLWSLQVLDASKFDLHCQVHFAGVPAQVVQVEGNLVRLLFAQDDDMVRPLVGSLLRDRMDCSWQAVVGGLMDHWSPIWNRDSRQEESDIEEWPQYCQLLHKVIGQAPPPELNLRDIEAWLHVARSLSPKKAVGVCGWHNAELKGLPRNALQDLADIFDSLPAFPDDLMRARVAVLSKVFEPSAASQARPITILSGLYRLWARVLCSQVLLTWSRTMPPGITGCLKQRSAVDLSFSLQAQVEAHLQDGEDFSGLCLDLRKAFNLLPRAPLGLTLRALGLPQAVCDFWLSSLQGLKRHFTVLGSLGPGLPSSTGAPEGDPVSVLGMLSICWVFVRLLEGLVNPSAYMDNWSWSTDLPDCHGPALLILQDLTDSLRVQIDWAKTYTWGTTPASQSWWREVGPAFVPPEVSLPVVSSARELGSFFQFGRRPERKLFQEKVQEALQRLHKLTSDPQVLPLKAKVAQAGVYPFLFYGTESLAPAPTTMQTLRGAVARAVVGGHHTLSPHAALHAIRHVQDPEVFLLVHHLRQLRRAFAVLPQVAQDVWIRVVGPEVSPRAVCGPAGALQNLLRRNGWSFEASGTCKGPLHCVFNIRTSSGPQIAVAVEQAWAETVQDSCQHRNGLRFAPVPCKTLTAKVLAAFRPWEQKLLARHFCGAFMSGAEKNSWSRSDLEACPLCGGTDTKSHKMFTCPALATAREPYKQVLDQVATDRPFWAHMPFASWPDSASLLQLLLQSLRLPGIGACMGPPAEETELFTDGSALHTEYPLARVTVWAVVAGCRSRAVWLPQENRHLPECLGCSFSVLVQGCTPGPQTVPRAELCAIVWASQWAQQFPDRTFSLHCDCAAAIKLWQDWQLHGWSAVASRANADLLLQAAPTPHLRLLKVKAHQAEQQVGQSSQYEQWRAAGNEAADAAAKQARADLPCVLRQSAQEVADHCRNETSLLKNYGCALLEVDVLDNKLRAAGLRQHQQEMEQEQTDALPDLLWRLQNWTIPLPGAPVLPEYWDVDWSGWPFGQDFGRSLVQWWDELVWPLQPAPPAQTWQVAYVELLANFVWITRQPPPVEAPNGGAGVRYIPLDRACANLQPCPQVQYRVMLSGCFATAATKNPGRDMACYGSWRCEAPPIFGFGRQSHWSCGKTLHEGRLLDSVSPGTLPNRSCCGDL